MFGERTHCREEREKGVFFGNAGEHALEALEKEGGKARSNEKRVIAAKDCPDVGACLKRHIDPPFFKVESVSSGIVKSQA